jgi:hypothetical protein
MTSVSVNSKPKSFSQKSNLDAVTKLMLYLELNPARDIYMISV